MLILVKSEFRVSRVVATSGRPGEMDSVGVVLTTDRGPVAILCAYAPPGPGLEGDTWLSLLDRMRPYSAIFLCGDFNAHHVGWGCSRSSPRGTALFEASLARDLVSINDARPTYVPDTGSTPSNIDLIFCPLSFAHLASVEVIEDPFGSDHLPVVLELSSSIAAVPRISCRINVGEVQLPKFREGVDVWLPRLSEALRSGSEPSAVYDEFIRSVRETLLEQGASGSGGTTRRRRAQPLWWSADCDAKIRQGLP